jgi:ankyrin repeat protein
MLWFGTLKNMVALYAIECTYTRKKVHYNSTHIDVLWLSRLINEQDATGTTPLMLALQKENSFMVKLLMAKKVDLTKLDKKGNSVFHYAAITSKEIIEVSVFFWIKFLNKRT